MKKTLALAALIICLLTQSALAAVNQKVLNRAVDIIATQESDHNYGLVITDTNGKISAGFIQWNAERAEALVKKVIAASGRDIAFDGSLSSSDKKWVSELLSTDAGKAVQDQQAASDVSGYIQKAMDLGIKDLNALCYFADIAHQVGSGAIVKYHKLAAEKAGGYDKVTLEHLYQAALNYATHTKARRTRVYNLIKANPITGDPDDIPHEDDKKPQQATKVSIRPTGAQTLRMGDKLALEAVFAPDGARADVAWSSNNKKVAVVEDGVVTPVRPGSAYIRVKTKAGLSDRIKVTVKSMVDGIQLSGDAQMEKGQRQTLKVAVKPAGASASFQWKSLSPKVVKVDRQGEITALRPGKAVILCKEAGGKLDRFTVKVTK